MKIKFNDSKKGTQILIYRILKTHVQIYQQLGSKFKLNPTLLPPKRQYRNFANAKLTVLANWWKMLSTPSSKIGLAGKLYFAVYAIL